VFYVLALVIVLLVIRDRAREIEEVPAAVAERVEIAE
jgi:hypothetical protein